MQLKAVTDMSFALRSYSQMHKRIVFVTVASWPTLQSGRGATRLPEALDRLIELYTATNKPDEVKKWRAERTKYPKAVPMPREKK